MSLTLMCQAESITISDTPTVIHFMAIIFFFNLDWYRLLLNFNKLLHIFLILLRLKEMDVASRDECCTSG